MKPEFRKVQSLMNDTSFAIVIPKGMVKKMGITKGDTLKISEFDDDAIMDIKFDFTDKEYLILEKVR